MAKALEKYRKKRDFGRTPEPEGIAEIPEDQPIFVIQKHDARNLHFDFRLEVKGVLKSWAVPKGPSADPSVKRLAVATEDHPMEYADFEGFIPEGEYGAGPVIVWDTGPYLNLTEKKGQQLTMETALEHGHATIWLEGRRLKGAYSLNRFRTGKQAQWLLTKVKDKHASSRDLIIEFQDSVLTGRTLEAISNESVALEHRDPHEPPKRRIAQKTERDPDLFPERIQPMLALLTKIPSQPETYGFEFKWDGIRAICYWDSKNLRIESRNRLEISFRWPELQPLGEVLGPTRAVLDGEIVAIDEDGKISFGLLAERMHLSKTPSQSMMRRVPIVFMIFDLLYLDNRNLMKLPYVERRGLLEGLDLKSDHWQVPPFYSGQGEQMLRAATENRLEGIMAKKLDGIYEPGKRSGAWLKIKSANRQEMVIGGWIPEKGSVGRGVGALLVGYYDESQKLMFAGKVGTGFTEATRLDLKRRLDRIVRDSSPFVSAPYKNAVYVEPKLVAEIEFREWTSAGSLRHPSFKGLREDKDPGTVVREDWKLPDERS